MLFNIRPTCMRMTRVSLSLMPKNSFRAGIMAFMMVVFPGGEVAQSVTASQDGNSARLNGRLLDQNGKSAGGCNVQLIVFPYNIKAKATTNADGKFSFEMEKRELLNFAVIAKHDTEKSVAVFYQRRDIRPSFDVAERLELKLSDAKSVVVKVRKDSKPVANAVVYGMFDAYTPLFRAVTDETGTATLLTHQVASIKRIWALGGEVGVAFWRGEEATNSSTDQISLELLPSRTCTATIVNEKGDPIPGLKVVPLVRFEQISNDLMIPFVPETHRKTDKKGVATFRFIPAKPVCFFTAQAFTQDYRMLNRSSADSNLQIQLKKRVSKFKVTGRVVGVPNGQQAAGIEVSGRGYGVDGSSSDFLATTNSDGEFACEVPAGMKFNVIAIGEKLASQESEIKLTNKNGLQINPLEIVMEPACVVNLSMTKGDPKQPVESTFFFLERKLMLTVKAPSGRLIRGSTSHRFSRLSDESGRARLALSPGEWVVSANLEKWSDKRTVKIGENQKSIDVNFHADVVGVRKVVGNAVLSDSKSPGSFDQLAGGSITLFDLSSGTEKFTGTIDKDGKWLVEGEFGNAVAILATSKNKKFAALQFLDISKNRPVNLRLRIAASVEGTLVDEAGKILPNREINLYYRTILRQRINYGGVKTDQNGNFQLTGVLPRISQKLSIKTGPGRFSFVGGDIRLKPGEARKNIRPVFIDYSKRVMAKSAPLKIDLSNDLKRLSRLSGLGGMRGLVLIHSGTDESQRIAENVTNLDAEQPGIERDIMSFLPKVFSIKDLGNQKTVLNHLLSDIDLSQTENSVVAIVLDSNQKVIGRIRMDDLKSGLPAARKLLSKTKLPQLDAKAEYKKKLELARDQGKTLFFVEGGPRCGPCFALLDWYDKNAHVLDKHFVLFKFSIGMENGIETRAKVRGDQSGGIPWFCFQDGSGQKICTSDGPLGNIGFPAGSKTSVDHLMKMVRQCRKDISEEDLAVLRKSLDR